MHLEAGAMSSSERRFYRVFNVFIRILLRSRLHALRSDRMVLLEFLGRRTGRHYAIPLDYWQPDPDHVVCLTSTQWSRWWRNLDGAEVALWLRGRRHAGRAELIRDPAVRRELVSAFFRHNPSDASYHGVAKDPGGRPDASGCVTVADNVDTKVIAIKISRS